MHLALTTNPGELRVGFTTFPKDRTTLAPARVVFGQARVSDPVLSTPTTYLPEQMCGAPANDTKAWVDPGVMHTALLSGLSQGPYFILITTAEGETRTVKGEFGLRDPTKVTFAAYGDMGTDHEAGNCTKILKSWLPEASLIVHVGDIAYARGRNNIWRDFMNLIEPLASTVPYMVNCGNHDCLDPGQEFQPPWLGYMLAGGDGGECGKAYNARFHMSDASGARNNVYYSFDHGPVHFLMASSEHDMRPGTPQYAFIEADLKAVDRKKTPFVFFGFHRPLYDVTYCGALLPETAEMRKILEPLLLKYRVDVAMHGHYHQYERTCALAESKCVNTAAGDAGPVYVTIGTAGKTTQCDWWDPAPAWTKFLSREYGVMKFTVHNNTHLTGAYYESLQGRLLDSFDVVRVAKHD